MYRFGPFELDARAGELRKHCIRIKLREQPVQILLMLLENPGEVVLREEIRHRLWPNGNRKPAPFLVTPFGERQARFSPEGRWVAYTSDESGQEEIYVRSFSMNSAGTAVEASSQLPISSELGQDPHWRGDGRELYYRARDGRVMAVEIASRPGVPGREAPTPWRCALRVWECELRVWESLGFFGRRQALSHTRDQGRTANVHGGVELAGGVEEIGPCWALMQLCRIRWRTRFPFASCEVREIDGVAS